MPLTSGTRIGPYEILGPLGAGGMGEVYRARDAKLDRDVAIKVLPDAVSRDPERLARFEREAKTLAALNHPNVAQIYAVEDGAIVMELIDGATLAGPLPIETALRYAGQIARALDAAHEKGIVHRDLKPGNVMVTRDGVVKVLDFSLAKALAPEGASATADRMSSPPMSTMTAMGTEVGLIIGTAAYMAPEQAAGKPVDKRADIWAFGVVLWEMLTGRRLFDGETVSHVLAAVLTKEPDLTAIPARVRPLVARCLVKDPRERLRDIGDAMSLVQDAQIADRSAGAAESDASASRASSRRWMAAAWVMTGVLAAALAGVLWWPRSATADDAPLVRFQIDRAADIYNQATRSFAVSPNGRLLAYYGAGKNGQLTALVRTLATGEVREIPGSSTFAPGANSLFWSPDSRQLVRNTRNIAQVFDLETGATRNLCDCRYAGGTWNRDGVILLGTSSNFAEGIARLSPGVAAPAMITKVDASRGERDMVPAFLPDGKRFLFTHVISATETATFLGSLDGAAPVRIADGSLQVVVSAEGSRPAYLLGIDSTGLVARTFDLDAAKAAGAPVTVVPGAVAVSASRNGVLVTSGGGSRPRMTPTWFDRKGATREAVGEAAPIDAVSISPDGRTLVLGETNDLWVRHVAGGSDTRITFTADNNKTTPVWSPDGTTIVYSVRRGGVNVLVEKPADGTGEERPLFASDRNSYVNDWSRDGRWIIFSTQEPTGTASNDLWAVPMDRGVARTPVPYIVGPGKQQQAQFSPDGRFVTYGSDESGVFEIYVQPFPNAAAGKWMVSKGGGTEPRWSRDGKELFYFSGQTLMAVPVSVLPTFSRGTPTALFDGPVQGGYTNDAQRWRVGAAGRFLLLANDGRDAGPPLDVIVNWFALLKK